MEKQKILLLDIETSPNLAYVWEKYEQDVLSFEKEREIISFAFKWLGEKSVKSFCLADSSKIELTKKLHKLFDEADIIVAHNGDEFDIKMANSSFVFHGLKPPSQYKTIDTLKIARSKFRFNSNKLDDLGKYLGFGEKIETGGFKLWLKCLRGDRGAWKKMKRYNKHDVVLLEKVYRILRPWATNLPNINKERGMVCPVCGSTNVQKRGFIITILFRKQRFNCRTCGHWSSSNINKNRGNKIEYLK